MEQLSRETLLGLLQVYEGGIRELRATDDRHLVGLLLRLERRRAEVMTAIAKKQGVAVTRTPKEARQLRSLRSRVSELGTN